MTARSIHQRGRDQWTPHRPSGLTREHVDGPIRPADWQPKSDRQIALRLAACMVLGACLLAVFVGAAAALP